MAKIDNGYILLARKSLTSEIWRTKPPLYWKIWSFILMKADYSDGTFTTSMAELQEVGSYYVGYRKVMPSQKQIRAILAYMSDKKSADSRRAHEGHNEGHTKVPMIGTTKVTDGITIKVHKYAEYQTFKNYEGHNEGHNEGRTKDARRTDEGRVEGELYPYINKNKKQNTEIQKGYGGASAPEPTLDQIREYIYTENLAVDPERFFDYYEQQGWKLSNGNNMKDWKASCRNWHRKEVEKMNQEKKKGLAF